MGSPSLSNTEKYKMWVSQEYECPLCEGPLRASEIFTPELVNIDHKIPRSRNGTNARHNLQLTHKLCNDLKADSMPDDPKLSDALIRVSSGGTLLDAYQVRTHSLWTAQDYVCGICRDDIKPSEVYRTSIARIFKRIPSRFGGKADLTNLHLVHVQCHFNAQRTIPYWVIDNLPELNER